MATEVLTIDDLCDRLQDLKAEMQDDGDEPVVLLGDIMGRFDVATPAEPGYSNMRIGDAGFSPDVFANSRDNSALKNAKDLLLNAIIVTEDDLSEQGRNLLPGEDGDEDVLTDGGITFANLRAFERDLLFAVRALERTSENPPKGLAIKSHLEREYPEEINHSRLYQNLDRLEEQDLLTKGRKDDRTNEYATTDRTRTLLETHARQRARQTGVELQAESTEQTKSVPDQTNPNHADMAEQEVGR